MKATRNSSTSGSARRRRRLRGVPAQVVFYVCLAAAVAGMAGAYTLGRDFIALPVLSSFFLIWALVTNDGKGFIRSRQMRRAYEPRGSFSQMEVLILFALLMLSAFVGVYVLLR